MGRKKGKRQAYSVIPERLAFLRNKKKLTQSDLSEQLSEYTPENPISYNQVCMWEGGRRPVTEKHVDSISEFFNVSKAYLFGLTDNEKEEFSEAVLCGDENPPYKIIESHNKLEIPFEHLYKYDMQPIYVEFTDFSYQSAWGIYNRANAEIVFVNMIISVTDLRKSGNVILYKVMSGYLDEYASDIKKPLDLLKLLNQKNVYIKMKSPDARVRAMYNGWYRHNENKTGLINAIGNVLPYEGLGVTYNAYTSGSKTEAEYLASQYGN